MREIEEAILELVRKADAGLPPRSLLDLLSDPDLPRGDARDVMQQMIDEGVLTVDDLRRLRAG